MVLLEAAGGGGGGCQGGGHPVIEMRRAEGEEYIITFQAELAHRRGRTGMRGHNKKKMKIKIKNETNRQRVFLCLLVGWD